MFNEPGKKIKRIAIGAFILECIGAFIGGIACMTDGEPLAGLAVMVGGFFAAWVIAIFIYGFGQLVDKVEDIAEKTTATPPTPITPAPKPTPAAEATKVDYTSTYAEPTEIKTVNEQAEANLREYKKQRLDSLYQKGAITEEEYKKAIMKLMK